MRFNATEILIQHFIQELRQGYQRVYGDWHTEYQDIIAWFGGMALNNIATGDALYHDVEHTIMVTLVGQEILHGKHIREGRVTPRDWLHCMIGLLCHDIGYVKGVCRRDRDGVYASGSGDETVTLAPGATGAALTPYHVDRGKVFLEERFGGHNLLDIEVLKNNIELTRFPVPSASDHQGTTHYPGLIRAADLIGQLSDPRYLNKIAGLFFEFEENGTNARLGYKSPNDLRLNYPRFYWSQVYPYIKDALPFLSLTQEGKNILANLYSNVFIVEHELRGDIPG